MQDKKIRANLDRFRKSQEPIDRNRSFDYCFNYFQSHHEKSDWPNSEISCHQLGFYLASWGMLRGSADLSKRSVKIFAPIIDLIIDSNKELWKIDADDYSAEARELIFEFRDKIRAKFNKMPSDILITKIMLGVFGSVPAFDTYFKKSFKHEFTHDALIRIGEFYSEHKELIDEYRIPTLDFETGGNTKYRYTRAKVIDMVYFTQGFAK